MKRFFKRMWMRVRIKARKTRKKMTDHTLIDFEQTERNIFEMFERICKGEHKLDYTPISKRRYVECEETGESMIIEANQIIIKTASKFYTIRISDNFTDYIKKNFDRRIESDAYQREQKMFEGTIYAMDDLIRKQNKIQPLFGVE